VEETAIQQPLLNNSFTSKRVCMEKIGNSNKGRMLSEELKS
jgi:hypothetical protein